MACLQKGGRCHSTFVGLPRRKEKMSAEHPCTIWRLDLSLIVKCKIDTVNRVPDTAYRVDIKSASLAAGILKTRLCVIYIPPGFQRETKKKYCFEGSGASLACF